MRTADRLRDVTRVILGSCIFTFAYFKLMKNPYEQIELQKKAAKEDEPAA